MKEIVWEDLLTCWQMRLAHVIMAIGFQSMEKLGENSSSGGIATSCGWSNY